MTATTWSTCVIQPPQALALGMVIHELATNAAKYGALTKGKVAVNWSIGADGLILTWQETSGPAVKKPKRHGFGTELIKGQIETVLNGNAELTFAAKGFQAQFTIPAQQFATVQETSQLPQTPPAPAGL
jgi:two-component sensor histidine kinase